MISIFLPLFNGTMPVPLHAGHFVKSLEAEDRNQPWPLHF